MNRFVSWVSMAAAVSLLAAPVFGQGYGTDMQNVMAPAAGGMAGVSIAEPQDVPAAVFGNPATLSQFHGTQFTLGGGWVEGYPTVTHDGFLEASLKGIAQPPYSTTSRTQGFVVPEIGVTQDLAGFGVPGTLGIGLAGAAGTGAEYRGQAPAGSYANDISTELLVLGMNAGVGVDVTERLALGAALTLGTGFDQLPLVQDSAMVHAYALRGNFGFDYKVNDSNSVAAFYQTEMSFNYPNAFRMPDGSYRDINVQQPQTVGLGFANRRFMDGNLLLAADIYYKLWENADLYKDIYLNQWVFAFGGQLTRGQNKFRLGYSYNTNPINHSVGSSLSGLPVAQAAIQFLQASETAAICQHRLTGGFGRTDVLPGVDLDFYAGGMFPASDAFGTHTQATVAAYYLGTGLTWRYGAHAVAEPSDVAQ